MTNEIQYQSSDGVATITLNRPSVLNALDDALMRGLRDALAQARADESVRALILTGAGRAFSAGADLNTTIPADGSLKAMDLGRLLRDRYNPIITGMRELPKPIISAVNGVAAGAGMSLALAGDIVLASRSATFMQAFVKIGLVPDAGSTWFLPRLAGDVRARALSMLGDRIDAESAERLGLVWKVHEDDQLLNEARALAAHMATQPTRAYGLIKEALNASSSNTLVAQLDLEADIQTKAGLTEDFHEGVTAFLEKRAPRFSGR